MNEEETFSKPGYMLHTINTVKAGGHVEKTAKNLLSEHVLQVYINQKLKMKIVCTPKDLSAMLLGHLYSESMINGLEDVGNVSISPDGQKAEITLLNTLESVADEVEMNSCNTGKWGTLGRASEAPLASRPKNLLIWEHQWLFTLAEAFAKGAPLYEKTQAIHSCMLMHQGKMICWCEDIGRHNALDKAIGKALLANIPLEESILYTSGRMPMDMVKKAIRVNAGMLASNTVPTHEAIALAVNHKLIIAGKVRPESFELYTV